MKKERIVKPNNLHPKGHKSSPEKKIDKFKLNLETVKEEEVVGRINTKKITDKIPRKRQDSPPLITTLKVVTKLKTITVLNLLPHIKFYINCSHPIYRLAKR